MAISPITAPTMPAVHHDLAQLKRGNLKPEEQRAAVAGQFEAILLRQFLQESIGSMLGDKGGSGGGSAGGAGGASVYGYMLTDSLAEKLSEGRGMGFASMIAKQLTPRGSLASVNNEEASEL